MKRVDLEKYLRAQGCEVLRQGGDHEQWINPATGATGAVPRHREVNTFTARNACQQLGVPPPPFR